MTQNDLAEAVGVSRSLITMLEREKAFLTMEQIKPFADALLLTEDLLTELSAISRGYNYYYG